jgi:hypothetical protein
LTTVMDTKWWPCLTWLFWVTWTKKIRLNMKASGFCLWDASPILPSTSIYNFYLRCGLESTKFIIILDKYFTKIMLTMVNVIINYGFYEIIS